MASFCNSGTADIGVRVGTLALFCFCCWSWVIAAVRDVAAIKGVLAGTDGHAVTVAATPLFEVVDPGGLTFGAGDAAVV